MRVLGPGVGSARDEAVLELASRACHGDRHVAAAYDAPILVAFDNEDERYVERRQQRVDVQIDRVPDRVEGERVMREQQIKQRLQRLIVHWLQGSQIANPRPLPPPLTPAPSRRARRSLRSSRWPPRSRSPPPAERASSAPCSGASTRAAPTRSTAASTPRACAGTAATTTILLPCELPAPLPCHRSRLLAIRTTRHTLVAEHDPHHTQVTPHPQPLTCTPSPAPPHPRPLTWGRYVTQLTGGAATNDLLFTFNNPSVAEVGLDAML